MGIYASYASCASLYGEYKKPALELLLHELER